MITFPPIRVVFALIATALFFQLAAGQTLSADSRPESPSGTCGTSCLPFSNCRTWSKDSNNQLTYYSNPQVVSPDPTANVKPYPESNSGYGKNYWMPWDSSNAVSGLVFAGHTAQTITFNSWFPVAMLSHVNQPISASIHVCNVLNLTIPFYLTYFDGTTHTASTTFPVGFIVEETPNKVCDSSYGGTVGPIAWQTAQKTCPYGPTVTSTCQSGCDCNNNYCGTSCNGNSCQHNYYSCNGCSDRVSISGGYTNNQILTLGGKSFFMAVLGFTKSSTFSPSDTPVSAFVTTEKANTTGYLYARLVQTCTSDSQCNDGIGCTVDQCLPATSPLNTGGYTQPFCYYSFNNSYCSNACGPGTCSTTGCTYSTACGYIAPVINCLTCSNSAGTCLVSLGYQVSGALATDSTGVVSIEPTSSNNFFTVNGNKVIDLGQPRNFYATGSSSSQVYSAGYVTIPMSGSSASLSWTLSGITVSLDQQTKCSGWGSCVTPTTPNTASLFSSLSTYLAVDTTATTYTFWYNFTVASTPKCLGSSSPDVTLQSLVVKIPTCSNGLTILSTTDGCYDSARAGGGTYLTSNIASLDSAISGASCLFDPNDGNMGFNAYDGFDIPLNSVGAGKTCLIGLRINYNTCPNVGWSATNSITSSGRVSFVTNKACTESCGVCNTLPLFGPISTQCAGSQPTCNGNYQYLDSSSCKCASCQSTSCGQNYQMDTTCNCVSCPAPTCPKGQLASSNYCDNTCISCPKSCSCDASDANCYQRTNYTNSQCGICITCPTKTNYTIVAGSSDCSYTQCTTSSYCDTNYSTYPSNLCDSCIPCDAAAIAATCGPNKTNAQHPCFCTDCTQTTCQDGYRLANPYSTCNATCVPCPTCPGNSTYADSTKNCTNGGTCLQCPYKACAQDYAPDPTNLCKCISCAPCANGTRTQTGVSCACTPCDKGCSTATGNVNGVDCTHGCTDPNNLCSDCIKCPQPTCPVNTTYATNYCLGCLPCNVTCPTGQITNPINSCACVSCSSSPSSPGYVQCQANYSLNTATCTCTPCTAPTCQAPTQANYADSCNTTCKTCSLSKNCPVNQTWDQVSYCNPCVPCPENTTNCAEGFVYVAPTKVNECPVCANCSYYFSNITCPPNQTRTNPCSEEVHGLPDSRKTTGLPGQLHGYLPADVLFNQTVDPLDSCLCKDCERPTCPNNYQPAEDYCDGCVECIFEECPSNSTRGDNTCNECTPCPVPACSASSQPNWADLCSGCVPCDKSETVCPVNHTVNINDTCTCVECKDPQCTGDYRYTSSNLCDGCTYCEPQECPANYTRSGLTSNCQPCYPCVVPTCPVGTKLTLQAGGCPYCATCVSGVNVPVCDFGFRVSSTDSCLCEACTAPTCAGNETAQTDPCLPCEKCPAPNCTANHTSLDYCDGCIPCTTVCTAGSVYTDPLNTCKGCTPCPLPSCGYGLEVADDLCSCTKCPTPTCSPGFDLDTTTGCGCVSCSNITCPLGTVLAADLCSCEVLTIYNQPNVTTTRCNSTERDACGICFGNNRTCLGCDGQIGSGRYIDACGVVCGTGTTCAGCTGDSCAICTGKVDLCGVCGGNSTTCDGCDGVAASGAVYDICGVCAGNGTSCLGCYGVPFGPACSNAISPGEAAAVSVLVALASLGCVALALIIWRMRSKPEILFQEWDNLIAEHLTEIQANPIFTSNETEVNPIFGHGHHHGN